MRHTEHCIPHATTQRVSREAAPPQGIGVALFQAPCDGLDADHARGELPIRELEHALLGFEMMEEARREAFEQAAARYVDFYLTHMAVEEREILPLAEAAYRALFTRIVNLMPAPVGLGDTR
jgi:hemerythrin-like domain-containing protein